MTPEKQKQVEAQVAEALKTDPDQKQDEAYRKADHCDLAEWRMIWCRQRDALRSQKVAQEDRRPGKEK